MLTQLNLIREIHALCYITYCALQQIEIYPVDSVIYLSNNQSLINNFSTHAVFWRVCFYGFFLFCHWFFFVLPLVFFVLPLVFFCFAIGFFLFCHWFFFWKHNGTDNESSKTSMITFYCDFWKAKTFGRRYKEFFGKSQSSHKHLTLRKIKENVNEKMRHLMVLHVNEMHV